MNTRIYTCAGSDSLHGSAVINALKGKRKSGGNIVFCSNCGNKLPEGARFCSFCGAKVAERFEVPAAPEKPAQSVQAAGEPKPAAEKPYEAALKRRVTFDWSNVIDEPQKKVVPDIKSPWATTGSIDEKELYAEMDAPSGRNRTMSFIDVLKAEKEEQAKNTPALETDVRPIQYTEVLDPGYLSGETAPAEPEKAAPVLHFAPLYEDIDEPVVTPFDIPEEEAEPVPSAEVQIEVTETEPQVDEKEPAAVYVPSGEAAIEAEPAAEEVVVESAAAAELEVPVQEPEAPAPEEIPEPTGKGFGGWFELPDFLKPKEEKTEAAAEVAVEEPEAPAEEEQTVEETVFEEAVFEETEEPAPAEESEVEETPVGYEDLITTSEEPGAYDNLVMPHEEHTAYEDLVMPHEEQKPFEALIMTPEEPAYYDELIMIPEEPAEIEVVEPVATEPEPVVTEPEPVTEAPEEAPEEVIYEADLYSSTEDEYLNLNTERSAESVRSASVEDEYDEEDEPVDEEELFTEIEETAPKHTGMTIAAPADKESEIEALKKRLAELMGTSWEEPAAPAEETPAEEAAEVVEEVVEEVSVEPEAVEAVEVFEEPVEVAEVVEEAEPELEAVEPEAVTFEPELILEEEEAEIEEPVLVFDEPEVAVAEPEQEETSAPEINIEDAYLDILETSSVSAAREEAAAEPEPEIEEPEAVAFEPELILEEEEAEIEEPVLVFDEPEVVVAEPELEETEIEEPVLAVEETESAVEEEIAEPEKPKTIDDFLAAILRDGAEEAPAEPVMEPMFTEPEVSADEDLGVVLTAADLVLEEPEEISAEPEPVIEEPVVTVAEPAADEEEPVVLEEVVEAATELAEEPSGFEIGLSDLIEADVPVEEVAPVAPEPVEEIVEVAETVAEPAEEILDIPLEPEAPAEEPAEKETDALSLEDLEKDLFGSAVPEGEVEATKKIDKFYTLYRKNEEFQRLLDEEYNKLKAAGGPAPEPAIPDEEPVSNKKIEDATIYQDFDLEKEAEKLREEQAQAEAAAAEEAAKAAKADAVTASAAAPVAAAAAAGAAMAVTDKNEELEYEEVEKGGGFLTILAVIIAILLIVLLGIILVLNFMPESAIAFKIDSIIENITSHFTAVDVMGRQLLL